MTTDWPDVPLLGFQSQLGEGRGAGPDLNPEGLGTGVWWARLRVWGAEGLTFDIVSKFAHSFPKRFPSPEAVGTVPQRVPARARY